MDKETLLSRIRQAHTPIESAGTALDDTALLGPAPGMDGWTRKDVLAHIEWWSDHAVNVIRGMRSGVDPYPGGDEPWDPDAWNARILAENRDRTAADVRRGESDAFAGLVAGVEAASHDELFSEDPHPWLDGTVAETVIEDSVAHYPDHLAHLA